MNVVKPPAFEELRSNLRSAKAAVQHLTESGFTPEQIEMKWGEQYA